MVARSMICRNIVYKIGPSPLLLLGRANHLRVEAAKVVVDRALLLRDRFLCQSQYRL